MREDGGAAPGEREQQGHAMEVLARLQLACSGDSPASVIAAHMSLSCAARLQSASSDGVVLEIPHPPGSTLLGSAAAVTFPAGEGMTSFVSSIIEVTEAPDGALLATFALPEELRFGDRRAAVRVPVPRGTVGATIVQGAARGSVQAIDISLLGILIEVEEERVSSIAVGGSIPLRLSFGALELLVNAEVRRRDGRRFGLLFVTDGGPPEHMGRIMWKLQKARLPSR